MQLREHDGIIVLIGPLAHDRVLAERNSLVGVFFMLKPGQTVGVGRLARDDVVVAVPVDVINEHLRAAGFGERHLMECPELCLGIRGRLLIPAILLQNVLAAVAVHIAHAHSVGIALVAAVR